MKKTIVALMLSAAAFSAFAADEGFYIGANVGQSRTDAFELSTNTLTAFSVIGGYQFTKSMAAELLWSDFGSAKLANGTSARIDGYAAKLVGIYPFDDTWSVFAKLGYAHAKMEGNVGTSKDDVTYGAGGQYNMNRNWGVNLNYDIYIVTGPAPRSQNATTKVPSIGVAFRL
jgi:hypothetical protein